MATMNDLNYKAHTFLVSPKRFLAIKMKLEPNYAEKKNYMSIPNLIAHKALFILI